MNEKGVLRLKEGEHPWGSREDTLCKLLGQIAAGPFPSGILAFKCFKIPDGGWWGGSQDPMGP